MSSDQLHEIREELGAIFLRFFLPAISVVLIGLFVGYWTAQVPQATLVVLIGAALATLGGGLLARSGRRYLACVFTSAFILFAIAWGIWFNGGVRAPAYVATIIPLVFLAWLVRPVYVYLALGAIVTLGLFAAMQPYLGFAMPARDFGVWVYWIAYSLFVGTAVLSVMVGSRLLRRAVVESEQRRVVSERGRRLLDGTFAAIGDAIVVFDAEFTITRSNPAADTLMQQLTKGQQHASFWEVEFEDDARRGPFRELLQGSGELDGVRLRLTDGLGKRWFLTSLARLGGDSGERVLVLRDISEQVKKDYQLSQSQRLEALGQLSSGIAHDFNNMLGAILGATEMIADDHQTVDVEMVQVIKGAAEKAAALTQELMVFARRNPTDSAVVDLHRIIGETVFLLRRTVDKSIEIATELNAPRAMVVGHEPMLQNALVNMGINASHAMPRGGRLTIRTSVRELDAAYCESSAFALLPGPHLAIAVEDTGAGMSAEVRAHIFEPFFTTKEVGKGTGLGLASVYATVQACQGAITVYSEPGEGTAFHILLPLNTDADHEPRAPLPAAAVAGSGRVLVVDDEELVRRSAVAMLESLGYEVLVACHGEEALALLQQHAVDCVLLDMRMPTLGGRATFDAMKQRNIATPVILASGFSEEEDVAHMREQGLFGFLSKPYLRGELAQLVGAAVARGQEQPAPAESDPAVSTQAVSDPPT